MVGSSFAGSGKAGSVPIGINAVQVVIAPVRRRDRGSRDTQSVEPDTIRQRSALDTYGVGAPVDGVRD
jgi:hypothetical protein